MSATALLAVAACQPENTALSPEAATVQRQSIYRQLEQLETQLPQSISLDTYGQPTGTPRIWLRDREVPGPAAFENSRVRRIIAIEELSELQAPEEDAPDFSAFWEIHGAYMRAGEISRFGHGQTGLVYSRPYPVDHLSGPHLAATELLTILDADANSSDIAALLSLLPEIATDIRNAHRRLELDQMAGIKPPPAALSAMIAQLETSPFASEDAFNTWLNSWRDQETEETPYSDWAIQLAEGLQSLVLPETLKLLESLRALSTETEVAGVVATMSPAYYDALLEQVTSGLTDAEGCLNDAQRLSEQTAIELNEHIAQHWDFHALTDEEGNLIVDGVEIPENPLEMFMVWQTRAPLIAPPPPPEPQLDPETGAPIPAAEPEIILPENFVTFENALNHLTSYLSAYSVQRLPSYELTPVLPPETPRRAPPPPVPDRLFDEPPLNAIFDRVPLNIATAYLDANSMALSVVDILQTYYPGHAYRTSKTERREDVPALSRRLSTLAFDLGWPAYSLNVLTSRSAFAEAPQLEAAMLYRRLEIFTEAEAETALLTGVITQEDAVNMLTSRLGISDADATERLLTFQVEPGIGCAATEGYLTFTRMRDRARGVLGNRLNIRDFHDVLLGAGSRPLQLVERDVDEWIATQVN